MTGLARSFAAVLIVVSMAGCTTDTMTSGPQSASGLYASSNRSMLVTETSDYRRTISEGIAVGAVVGGLGAAVITAAAGGDSNEVLRNGLIGAAVGGLVGGAVGQNVANTKRDYVRREDGLNAVIAQARSNNTKLSRMVRTSQALVQERRRQLASLSKSDKKARQAIDNALDGDRRAIDGAISSSEKEIRQLRILRDRYANNPALGNQISAAESSKNALVASRNQIRSIEETIK